MTHTYMYYGVCLLSLNPNFKYMTTTTTFVFMCFNIIMMSFIFRCFWLLYNEEGYYHYGALNLLYHRATKLKDSVIHCCEEVSGFINL